MKSMQSPHDLAEQALAWLRQHYTEYRFFVERDIVWTVQSYLRRHIDEVGLPYRIYNDYAILPGSRRGLSADLAIVNAANWVEVAIEFKYEPSHMRPELLKQKFPVVFWDKGVGNDVKRIREFVIVGKANAAYSVFIDEGGYFRQRPPFPGSEWQAWENGVWVLTSQVRLTDAPK